MAIYLNDHLAGATLGVELARRLRSSNAGEPRFGAATAEICAEIEADRTTLEQVLERLGVGRSTLKPAGAWVAEKLGRLKPNGRLRGYSPLSRMVELEMIHIGITGKIQLWEVLGGVVEPGSEFDFEQLARRAASQRERVEDMHRLAASEAFGGSDGSS